jgi:hypothetical protein
MQKPSRKTILKHVDKLMKLVRKGKGKLPTYSWLNEHGYFRSYELMRQFPGYFKGIRGARAYAKR